MYDKIKKEVMVERHFGCSIGDIAENVIVSPVWRICDFMEMADKCIKEFEGWYKGATLLYKDKPVTVVSSGIGAPMTGDCVLALQYTNCRNLIFSGSAGAINKALHIGDFLAAHEAVIGEGFSRYHRDGFDKDYFGQLSTGDERQNKLLYDTAKAYEKRLGNKVIMGRVFSTDSILGETKEAFEYMMEKGCDVIEMEVSAVFTACRKASINAAAFIIISDLPLVYRSLFEGITEQDKKHYEDIRSAMPEILLETAVKL